MGVVKTQGCFSVRDFDKNLCSVADLSVSSQLIPLSLCTYAEISKLWSTKSEAFSSNLPHPQPKPIYLVKCQWNAEDNKEANQESTFIRIQGKRIFIKLNPLILE